MALKNFNSTQWWILTWIASLVLAGAHNCRLVMAIPSSSRSQRKYHEDSSASVAGIVGKRCDPPSTSLSVPLTARPTARSVRIRTDINSGCIAKPWNGNEYEVAEGEDVEYYQWIQLNFTLADRLLDLTSDVTHSDFRQRLLHEELEKELQQRRARKSVHSKKHSRGNKGILWKSVLTGSLLLVVGTSLFSSEAASSLRLRFQDTEKTLFSVLWLPFLWTRPSPTLVMDTILYLQILFKPDILQYLRQQVLPATVKTFRRLLILELWNQVWAGASKHFGPMFDLSPKRQSCVAAYGENKHSAGTFQVPDWVSDSHSFVVRAVKRGTRKIVQKAIQLHVQESFLTAIGLVHSAIQGHFDSMPST